jgi:hypothetical protein
MRTSVLAVVGLMAALLVTPVWAGGSSQGSSPLDNAAPEASTKLSAYRITLKLTKNNTAPIGPCTGAVQNYADVCPFGPCFCFTFNGTASGSAGKGTAALYETVDTGSVYPSGFAGCANVYGEIDITGSKDVEAIAFDGTSCSGLGHGFLSGGCALGVSNVYTSAIAQCSGTDTVTKLNTFKIKGSAQK